MVSHWVRRFGTRLALIAGVVAAAVLIAFGVDRVRMLMGNARVPDGDRLNFYGAMLGAVVGAILAIGGALLIEEVRLYMDGRSDRRLIQDALAGLETTFEPIADDPITFEKPELWSVVNTRLALGEALLVLGDASAVLVSAPSRARLGTFRQVSAINRVVEVAAMLRAEIEDSARLSDDELAAVMKERIKPRVERLLQHIAVGSRILRG